MGRDASNLDTVSGPITGAGTVRNRPQSGLMATATAGQSPNDQPSPHVHAAASLLL